MYGSQDLTLENYLDVKDVKVSIETVDFLSATPGVELIAYDHRFLLELEPMSSNSR